MNWCSKFIQVAVFWEWKHHFPFSHLLHAHHAASPTHIDSEVQRIGRIDTSKRQQCVNTEQQTVIFNDRVGQQRNVENKAYTRHNSSNDNAINSNKSSEQGGALHVTSSCAEQPLLPCESCPMREPTIEDAVLEWEEFVLKGWREVQERLPSWQSVGALYHV